MKLTAESSLGLRRYYPSTGTYGNSIALEYPAPTEALNRYRADDFYQLPDPTVVDLSDGSQMRAYEVLPQGDYDETRQIVRIMDFANGIAPHSYAAALAVAELLRHPVYVVPQNEITLSRSERQFVKYGDLSPLANKWAEGLEALIAKDHDITLYGYSFGAQAAVNVSKAINEHGVKQNDRLVVVEPPNAIERSKVQLLRAFSAAGNPQWAEATRQSNWQALIDLVGVSEADISEYMKADIAKFAHRALNLSNMAIIGAMQQASLAEDLRAAGVYLPGNGSVVVARVVGSRMVPGFGLEDTINYARPTYERLGRSLVGYVIESGPDAQPTGHAVGNNPLVPASVIARA